MAHDRAVISKKVQRDLGRLAARLSPRAQGLESSWRRRVSKRFTQKLGPARLRALAALNPGTWWDELATGNLTSVLETVEYHGRRLAKLDVPPQAVLASMGEYQKVLLSELKREFPRDCARYEAALERLYFCMRLTLNDAYYQVRDLEAKAFYEVLQDQLESLRVSELLHRVLETLLKTFRADAGVILLRQSGSRRLEVKAWKGMEAALAGKFRTTVGSGFAGEIARSGKTHAVVDVKKEARVKDPEIRQHFTSMWGAPLAVASKVTGVLELAFAREYHCLPREKKLLEAIAERCALAIDKAQLLEELHDREEQIRKLGEHIMKVEEEERRRISRELHDEVGQSLLVVRLYLEMVRNGLHENGHKVSPKLQEAQEVAENTIREMRRLISALSPNVLQELGLSAGIRQFVKNFSRAFSGRVRLKMSNVEGLPETATIMVYRLVQECITNAVKHSHAQNVALNLNRRNGLVRLKVEDDGVGFDPEEAERKRESFGLSGMRERVTLLGGKIDIQSAPGRGTKVAISIPV